MSKVLATFHPQAWINDYACAVDPEGETTWDVTAEIVAVGREQALKLIDDQYSTDALRYSARAPKWIQEWSGPFYVEVEEAIREFYAEEKRYLVITGDFSSGFMFHGPFNSFDDAAESAAGREPNSWVSVMWPPVLEEEKTNVSN